MPSASSSSGYRQSGPDGKADDEAADDEQPWWDSGVHNDQTGNDDDEHDPTANESDKLYAILNLPKDCSQDDIAKSYKRLAGQRGTPIPCISHNNLPDPRDYCTQPCCIRIAIRTRR